MPIIRMPIVRMPIVRMLIVLAPVFVTYDHQIHDCNKGIKYYGMYDYNY